MTTARPLRGWAVRQRHRCPGLSASSSFRYRRSVFQRVMLSPSRWSRTYGRFCPNAGRSAASSCSRRRIAVSGGRRETYRLIVRSSRQQVASVTPVFRQMSATGAPLSVCGRACTICSGCTTRELVGHCPRLRSQAVQSGILLDTAPGLQAQAMQGQHMASTPERMATQDPAAKLARQRLSVRQLAEALGSVASAGRKPTMDRPSCDE